jgi:hypothetical protein
MSLLIEHQSTSSTAAPRYLLVGKYSAELWTEASIHHRALKVATRFDAEANITHAEKPRRRHSRHQIGRPYLDTFTHEIFR